MASKRKKTESLKSPTIFDDSSILDESIHDPYSDDGEYGSDKDFLPKNQESSDSDESIFGLRGRRQIQKQILSETERSETDEDHRKTDVDDNKNDDTTDVETDDEIFHQSKTTELRHSAQIYVPNVENEQRMTENSQSNLAQEVLQSDLGLDLIEPDIIQESNEQSQENLTPEANTWPPPPHLCEGWEVNTTDIPEFGFDDTLKGPHIPIDQNTQVRDMFDHLFTPEIIDYLVTCTNAYGKSLTQQNRPHTRYARNKVFREVNADEMKTFLGLSLLQGQINIHDRRKLFTKTNPLYYHPIFGHCMSGRRYEQILRCLCAAEVGAKGAEKISEFIEMLTRIFRNAYYPDKELSLDESMLLYRGRLIFRTYMKNKKTKYGIKFYVLTSADGYVLNMKMYCGKNDVEDEESRESPKLEKLVLRLMRPYLLKGHELYMDNFYYSVSLSEKLLDLKTHTNGTLRANRKGVPKVLTNRKITKGEHVWMQKNRVYVSFWKDKRKVLMITTMDHPEIVDARNKRGQNRKKPKEVVRYNTHMAGVDRSDQMMSYYSCPRKSIRWYKKVLFHLLDVSTWNAYYLYKRYVKQNNKKYEFIEFRETLIQSLLKIDEGISAKDLFTNKIPNWGKQRRQEASSSAPTTSENRAVGHASVAGVTEAGHWPIRIPAKEGNKKKYAFLACRICMQKKIRRETSYRCKGCINSPALCPECFEEWHLSLEN